MSLAINFKFIPLFFGTISPNGGDVDHTGTELDEGASFDGNFEVGDVVETEIQETGVLLGW